MKLSPSINNLNQLLFSDVERSYFELRSTPAPLQGFFSSFASLQLRFCSTPAPLQLRSTPVALQLHSSTASTLLHSSWASAPLRSSAASTLLHSSCASAPLHSSTASTSLHSSVIADNTKYSTLGGEGWAQLRKRNRERERNQLETLHKFGNINGGILTVTFCPTMFCPFLFLFLTKKKKGEGKGERTITLLYKKW